MRRNGWFKESHRHSLAARGIQTRRYMQKKNGNDRLQFVDVNRIAGGTGTSGTGGQQKEDPVEAARQDRAKEISDASKPVVPGKSLPTSPRTQADRIRDEKRLEKALEKERVEERQFSKLLEGVRNRQFDKALERLERGTLPQDQQDALIAELGSQAVDLAEAGRPVPTKVRNALRYGSPEVSRTERLTKGLESAPGQQALEELRRIEEQRRSEDESPLRSALREEARAAAVKAADAPIETAEGLVRGGVEAERAGVRALTEGTDRPTRGVDTKISELGETPFVGTNVFVGNEEDGMLRPIQEPIPKTSSSFGFLDQEQERTGSETNVLFKQDDAKQDTAQKVTSQIESLYGARNNLGRVDLDSFDRGNKAFKEGDREGVIKAITDLQMEEDKLKDRWQLLEQTHSQMLSNGNHRALFDEDSSAGVTNVALRGTGKGGRQLSEQTEKLNEVRQAIKEANDKVFARRRMLQFRLRRLDANVLPEQGAPDFDEIKRFSGDDSQNGRFGGVFDTLKGIDNIALRRSDE